MEWNTIIIWSLCMILGFLVADLVVRMIMAMIDKPEGYLYIEDDVYPYMALNENRPPEKFKNGERFVLEVRHLPRKK